VGVGEAVTHGSIPTGMVTAMYTDRFTRSGGVADSLLAIGFVLAWSSGFIGATLGTRDAGALTLLMWRFVIAAPLLLAWAARRPAPHLGAREVALQSVIGLLSQGAYLLGVVLAVDAGVATGTVALVAAVQPILAAALAQPLLGERVRRVQWLGLLVGLAGVAVVVAGDLGAAGGAPAWAHALPFGAVAGLTAATLLERRLRPVASVSQSLAIQCTGSAVVFSALALADGSAAPAPEATFWVAVAWVIGPATIGGYGLYWINAARGGVTRTSSLLYLTPPTTALWALLMFAEPIRAGTLLGLALCLAGVLLARGAPAPYSPGGGASRVGTITGAGASLTDSRKTSGRA
jgi:drug/metabolite transporter (DMT)-like permease